MADQARQHTGLPADLPIRFHVDNQPYELPDVPTRVWLETLPVQPPGCWWNLIPARLDHAETLYGRLLDPDDDLDLDRLEHVAEQVLGAVCGLDFHAACRLAAMVYGNWLVFDGYCTTVGFRPLHEPISRVLAAAYTWRRSLCSKEAEIARLDSEIWAPPPPETASGAARDAVPPSWSDEREADAFASAMSMLTTAGRGR